jgi:hypothetical protein
MKKLRGAPALTNFLGGEEGHHPCAGKPLPVLTQSNVLRMVAACLGATAISASFLVGPVAVRWEKKRKNVRPVGAEGW